MPRIRELKRCPICGAKATAKLNGCEHQIQWVRFMEIAPTHTQKGLYAASTGVPQ